MEQKEGLRNFALNIKETIRKLRSARGKPGLPIERDLYFGQPQIKDIK